MPVFPSIDGEPALDKVFRRFPKTLAPLLEYHDRLLRDPGPLTVAERAVRIARMGGAGDDPHRAERSHTRLAKMWGVTEG